MLYVIFIRAKLSTTDVSAQWTVQLGLFLNYSSLLHKYGKCDLASFAESLICLSFPTTADDSADA